MSPDVNQKVCPKCSQGFEPKRSNQRYCSRACQKSATRNTSRNDRTAENKKRSAIHYERATRLKEMVYTVAPQERLGVMKDILDFIPVDAGLRNILCDLSLLSQPPSMSGRLNIAKAANAYVRKFFGVSIQTYVRSASA